MPKGPIILMKELLDTVALKDLEKFKNVLQEVKNEKLDISKIINSTKNKDGNGLLHIAASDGMTSFIDILLDNGAEIDMQCSNGMTPLHFAAKEGHTEVGKILIKRKARLDIMTVTLVETPLFFAAYYGHKDFCELLLVNGAICKIINKNGSNPIARAREGKKENKDEIAQFINNFHQQMKWKINAIKYNEFLEKENEIKALMLSKTKLENELMLAINKINLLQKRHELYLDYKNKFLVFFGIATTFCWLGCTLYKIYGNELFEDKAKVAVDAGAYVPPIAVALYLLYWFVDYLRKGAKQLNDLLENMKKQASELKDKLNLISENIIDLLDSGKATIDQTTTILKDAKSPLADVLIELRKVLKDDTKAIVQALKDGIKDGKFTPEIKFTIKDIILGPAIPSPVIPSLPHPVPPSLPLGLPIPLKFP